MTSGVTAVRGFCWRTRNLRSEWDVGRRNELDPLNCKPPRFAADATIAAQDNAFMKLSRFRSSDWSVTWGRHTIQKRGDRAG